MPAPTVAVELFNAVFDYLEQQGISETAFCEKLKIKSRNSVDIDGRIPLSLYEKAFITAEEMTEDPAVGLHMGHSLFPRTTGVFYFISIAGKNVKEIVEAVIKYFPIAYDFVRLEIKAEKNYLDIIFRYENQRPHRHVVEHLFSHWYSLANRLTFDAHNVPRTLEFAHESSLDQQTVESVFQPVPVSFNAPQDQIKLGIEGVNYHTALSDQRVFQLNEQRAAHLLLKLRSQDRIAREVTRHVLDLLGRGAPGIREVAASMQCSGRTLQRRLAERNLTYQMLLDSIRAELAIELLSTTSLPITQIARRTGFSDDSTFHRAFKKWTGKPPADYRHRNDPTIASGHNVSMEH